MTKKETCKALGISMATCNRWRRDGKLVYAKKCNGHVDFDTASIQAMKQEIAARLMAKLDMVQ